MCAVCWTGTQIIPATAIAARYVWVNRLGGRRRTDEPDGHDASADAVPEALAPADEELVERQLEPAEPELVTLR